MLCLGKSRQAAFSAATCISGWPKNEKINGGLIETEGRKKVSVRMRENY